VSLSEGIPPARRFPLYAAFPRSEYYQRVRLPSQRLPAFGCAWCTAYSGYAEDRDGSPRFLTIPFPSVPCSQTAPRSPAASPIDGCLL
jgi:hypothetical protein